jgi:hypothetical protein
VLSISGLDFATTLLKATAVLASTRRRKMDGNHEVCHVETIEKWW